MKLSDFEAVIQALHDVRVQYVVVGGVAVNAHGHIRFMPDIDLAIELIPGTIRKALRALATLNHHPTGPIDAEALAGRKQHPQGGGAFEAQLLMFNNEVRTCTPVNLLAQDAFNFRREYEQAIRIEILPRVEVRFLSIPALIQLKRTVDRPRDSDAIQHLRWLQEDYGHIGENDEGFLWSMATLEGARKMQLIRNKKLSIRERLESLGDLTEVSEYIQAIPQQSSPKTDVAI